MLFFVLLCALAVAHAQNTLQVNTTQGLIQGAKANDGNYFEFFGIHYGGKVSGENRFKAPTPAPSYPGLFHAVDSNVICAQPSSRGLIGVEDCLTLNVFTTGVTPAKPVLVWLIGEEYTKTDLIVKSFRQLVLEDIVIVQINYRVSIFGFLCLGVAEAPGNAGLRDVVQGLKWIQQNIAGFGGDPNNVILFGHGSGAAMVDLITMSPLANNLVHKAIAQSGSALSPWAIAYDPIGYAKSLGIKLGYTDKTPEELAKLLVGTDTSVLVNTLSDYEFRNNSILFAPCIEDMKLNPNDTFLADSPINLLKSGKYSHIPYIAGYVDQEGTMRAGQAVLNQWLDKMQANFSEFIQVDLDLKENRTAVEKDIREFYFATRNINMETIDDYLDYQGDTLILVSVIRAAKERASTSTAPVRLYEFAYKGGQNSDWVYNTIPINGATHGSVPKFLLNYDLKSDDQTTMKSLLGRYIGFFKTGNPIQSTAPGPVWEPVTKDQTKYLLYSGGQGPVLNTSIHTELSDMNPHQQRMAFWNDIYSKYYKAPQPVSGADRIVTSLVMFVLVLVHLF